MRGVLAVGSAVAVMVSSGVACGSGATSATVCGKLDYTEGSKTSQAAIAVQQGRIDCSEAVRIIHAYYAPQTRTEGSGRFATVEGWECASNSSAGIKETGEHSSCHKDGTTIVVKDLP
ncbi:hypothetical protein [Nonomuraea candida]|uniref:hypothetical protein n=1 Tax=Nonomuraea candida TaxID=359159 RepID=UPI0005BE69A1|nr:hypothetical protein [Nonomuraea candida]